MRALLVILAYLIFNPHILLAESCADGRPLLQLVSTSDAIAVLKRKSLIGGVHPQGYAVQGFYFTFEEFVKYPVLEGFDLKQRQLLRHKTKLLRVRDPRKYFAFLRYVSPNVWTVIPCGLLNVAADNDVEDACTRISDLYGENRFVRERRCLLSPNPDVGVQALRKQVEDAMLDKQTFRGHGTVISADSWNPSQNFLRIRFRLDGRQRKELFRGKTVRRPFPTLAYLKTESITEQRYRKRSRKGRRCEFRALWYKGSLLLEDFE